MQAVQDKSSLARPQKNKVIALVAVLVIAAAAFWLVMARATGFFASVDPANGTVGTNATVVTDSTAVGGKAVQFNAPPTTNPPSSPPSSPPPSQTPGLTNPNVLTAYTGSNTITSGTHVIENKRFTNALTVKGGTVTIRNSSFNFDDYFHLIAEGGTVIVENSEFDGMNTKTNGDDIGLSGSRVTVRYSVFKRLVNAMRLSSNSTAEYNIISQPNTVYRQSNGEPAHGDGIEIYDGSNIVVRGNKINISGGMGETGCVNIASDFGNISNVLVEDNDFTGGTFSFYTRVQGEGDSITDVKVKNNRWHSPSIYGTHSVEPRSAISVWSGNTYNGNPLSL